MSLQQRIGIMQPYFMPYLGYFQLMAAADKMVIYDNIQYTKKGWISRNRFLRNGTDAVFSLSLKNAPEGLSVRERQLADTYDRNKLINQLREAYRRAPVFASAFPVVEACISNPEPNLFKYILHSIQQVCTYAAIDTPIIISSAVDMDHDLRAQEKVTAMCLALGGSEYTNLPGGRALYDPEAFRAAGLTLSFLQPRDVVYEQFTNPFVPWLSIIDVMMFNPQEVVRDILHSRYDIQAAS